MTVAFEILPAGTNGAAVAPDAAKWDTITGSVTYDTSRHFEDLTASVKMVCDAVTTAVGDQQLAAAVSTRYITRVWRVATFNAGSFATLCRLRSASNASLDEVRINSSGQLLLRQGSTGNTLATHFVGLDSTFRFEWDIAAGQQSLRVYLDQTSSTPDGSYGPFTYDGGAFQHIVDGIGTAPAATTGWLLYAVDGDAAPNPSISRWGTQPATEGVRLFFVAGAAEVPIVSLDVGPNPGGPVTGTPWVDSAPWVDSDPWVD